MPWSPVQPLLYADITIPPEKTDIINKSLSEVEDVQKDFRRGLLTEQEQNERVIEIWQLTTKQVGDAVRNYMDPNGNIAVMANSGATKGGFRSNFTVGRYAWFDG